MRTAASVSPRAIPNRTPVSRQRAANATSSITLARIAAWPPQRAYADALIRMN